MKNIYYVYVYCNPLKPFSDDAFPELTSQPFYVGKGKAKRYLSHLQEAILNLPSRNLHKHNTIKKLLCANLTPDIILHKTCLTEDEAFSIEIELVKHFGRRDLNAGILCNLSDGGDGNSGYKYTEEQKARLRASLTLQDYEAKAKKFSKTTTGRRHSEEHKKKISDANKGRIFTQDHIDKYTQARIANGTAVRTEECKKKISNTLKGYKQSQETKNKRVESLRKNNPNAFKTSMKTWLILDTINHVELTVSDFKRFCDERNLNTQHITYTRKSGKEHPKTPGWIVLREIPKNQTTS